MTSILKTVDFVQIFLVGIIISMISEYFVHQHFFLRFEKWLLLKNHNRIFKFFFCRFCFIGKASMIVAIFYRPVMLLFSTHYLIWTILEWFINFLIINFIALIVDGFLQDKLSRIYKRQEYEFNLLNKTKPVGRGKGFNDK